VQTRRTVKGEDKRKGAGEVKQQIKWMGATKVKRQYGVWVQD